MDLKQLNKNLKKHHLVVTETTDAVNEPLYILRDLSENYFDGSKSSNSFEDCLEIAYFTEENIGNDVYENLIPMNAVKALISAIEKQKE